MSDRPSDKKTGATPPSAGAEAPTIAPAAPPESPILEGVATSVHEEATVPPRTDATIDLTPLPHDMRTADALGRAIPAGRETAEPVHVRYFGDYEIIREIARGGMGVVFQARQVSLNRTVALKMILAGQLADETRRPRFYTEAEAAANLDHPGIVPIYEVGQHEGQHYFSMGFVEGQSLSQRLADGPLPPREAAELIRRGRRGDRVCPPARGDPPRSQAGQYPARPERQPAGHRLRAGQEAGGRQRPDGLGPDHGDAELHAAGAGRGQARRGRSGGRRLRSGGDALCPGDRPAAVPGGHGDGHRAPGHQRRAGLAAAVESCDLDRDLETICLKCLEKEPARRYASAAALAEELARFLAGEPILARPIGAPARLWRWCRRRPVVAGLGAAVAALILFVAVAGPLVAVSQSRLRNLARAGEEALGRSKAEAARRLEAEQAGYEATTKALAADQALVQSYLSQAENLRNLAQPGRQGRALELLKRASGLKHDTDSLAAKLDADPAGLRPAMTQFWREQRPRLRSEAARWFGEFSLKLLYDTRFPVLMRSPSGDAIPS